MGIDWFTLVAQILNFVILLFLLKRFLYRPVLDAIAQREQRIRDGLEKARRKEEDAEAQGMELRERRSELEARRAELLAEAEQDAEARRRELGEEIRRHADKVREEWRETLRQQQETFLQELRRRIGEEAYALTRRAMRDLADGDLEEQAVRVFLGRVRAMDEEDRREFLSALEDSRARLAIRTAFDLTPDLRGHIEEVLGAWAGAKPDIHFETDPDLALGIEMRAGDRKIGWSVGSYLDELEDRTRDLLEAETR